MLNEKVAEGREPTEHELQDVAKAMYGELLARYAPISGRCRG